MNPAQGLNESYPAVETASDLRFLRIMLVLQGVLGLLWGISMLFFARQIVRGSSEGPHVEKIAQEGAAHMALVFGAVLDWRDPRQNRGVLLVMIFLNALWTLTDLVYIPLLGLSEIDFYAKVIVTAILAVGLALSGRGTGVI